MLAIYQAVLIASVAGIMYIIFVALLSISSFHDTYKLLDKGGTPPMTSIEQYMANKFNLYFFGAAYLTCTGRFCS